MKNIENSLFCKFTENQLEIDESPRFRKYEGIQDSIEDIEEYGSFICLSEDAKEYIKNMNDRELDIFSWLIASSIRNTYINIQEEIDGRHKPKDDF